MNNIIDATVETPHPFNYDKKRERAQACSESFNIAFLTDTHLGYRAYNRSDARGINLREMDGDMALMESVNGIIEDPEVHAVLHGGDFYHFSHPQARLVKNLQMASNRFAENGIALYGHSGNHDTSDKKNDLTSVALLDDPSRHSHALWLPYQVYKIHDGIYLHSISHHGLSSGQAPEVKAIPGAINIFSTHGAALDPRNHTLMSCEGSVREQIIPLDLIIDEDFQAKLLGHYHKRYQIGDSRYNAWYGGSTVRRGFSDEPGERGWLMVRIFPNGDVKVESRNIRQRPQFDLGLIDASGMSATELQERMHAQIASIPLDLDSDVFNEMDAPIVRQRVINVTRSLRAGLDLQELAKRSRNMLDWKPEYIRPEAVLADPHNHNSKDVAASLSGGRQGGGAVAAFDDWTNSSSVLAHLPESEHKVVRSTARTHLESAQNQRGN